MLSTGSKVHDNSGEEEFLNLMYDPCLNCYFDPQSGKYYELLWSRDEKHVDQYCHYVWI